MRVLLLAAALLAASSTAAAAAPAPPVLFSCSFGAKQVVITGTTDLVSYRFGPRRKPELTFSAEPSSGRVFSRHELYPRAVNNQLRMTNGDFNYVVYSRAYFGNAAHEGADEYSGLLVLRGAKLLANMRCKSGDGFSDVDLDTLPKDADEAFDISNFVE